MSDDEPNIFDLEDWIADNYPHVYDATRYMQIDVQYPLFVKIWKLDGKPSLTNLLEPCP